MDIKIGQLIRFKFGKQPATREGMALEARRSSNMTEHRIQQATAYQGEWIDLYACDVVVKVADGLVYTRDGCRFKASEVEVLK